MFPLPEWWRQLREGTRDQIIGEARRLTNESLQIARRLGDQGSIALSLGQLGRVVEAEGNQKEAARLYSEALAIFERLKSPYADIVRRSLERLEGKGPDK